ncbi:helix-turn-helix domain-containing protein [Pararhizobium haloflavum]|uniref:helix-turn-helix domain-containing protein n=1 Tax=Pararhizobium haloflavum TaxID=2037914 RepID=UPI000C19FAF8|nr:helix-turn-helix transcriptional regulator [Pararhizobium haloflavum]
MYTHPQQTMDSEQVLQLRQRAGRWLRILRENSGLSQRQLAKAVGVDYYTFISQIEAGRGRIPPERYAAFARAYNVEPRFFVRELMRYYDPVTHGILFPDSDHSTANGA